MFTKMVLLRSKRKRVDDQGGRLQMKLRKTGAGMWQGEKLGLRLKKNTLGMWEANESTMDEMMDPLLDVPEFSASFQKLIRPAVRKSKQRIRMNIPDDCPTPPPSSSDEDLFMPPKKLKKKVPRKRK